MPARGFSAKLFALCLVLTTLPSCGRSLPKYAEPHSESMDPAAMEARDRIFYRALTPEDFLAKAPPSGMRAYAERMGAVTCAHVFTSPDPVYYVEETESGFRGAYEHLNFVAKMDRECSWWNPKQGSVPQKYILQHEQIHFALAEVAARRLDEQAQELIATLKPTGKTSKSVEDQLTEPVEELLSKTVKELLERNRDFDEDTSNKYAPDVQQRWYDEVAAELRQ